MGTNIIYPSAGNRSNWQKHGERVSVLDYMIVTPDFSTAMNAAITHAGRGASALQGIRAGISIQIPGGTYTANSPILANQPNLLIYGEGAQTTIIHRGADMPAGKGVFHITTSNVKFRDFGVDGAVTTSVGLQYTTFAYDPMNPLLTINTSFWVQGNAAATITDISFENITIQHTGGYAILLDATTGNISRVKIAKCLCKNNRPHKFGFSSGDLNYGSWTGGFHYQSDGTLYCVTDLLVTHCSFERVTGNCIWGHLYAFTTIHHNIRVKGCSFLDCGLDGVLMGGVSGGVVEGNTFRRIGYMTSDDTSQSVPRLLPNANAVAMDTSGFCMGVNYVNNTSVSANGGHLDLDGFCQGTVVGNKCRTPRTTDPEYTEDQIAASGWGGGAGAGTPNYAYGINTGNSSRNQGGEGVTVVGNSFINLCGGSIRLYAGRDCTVGDNDIEAPSNSLVAPIVMGNTDMTDNRRSYNNVIHGNRIDYSPASGGGVAAAIYEDGSFAAFQPTDSNWVYGNHLTGDGSAVEFQKNSITASVAKTVHASLLSSTGAFLSSSFQPSSHFVQREGRGLDYSSALRWYLVEGNTSPVLNMQLQGYRAVGAQEPLLNVSSAGTLGTGVYATGNRTQAVFGDCIVTGKLYGDSMLCLTDTTYVGGDQVLLPSTVAVVRYISSTGALQTSLAAPNGLRQVFMQLGAESTLSRGFVNTLGTGVVWQSGLKFSQWAAGSILIIAGLPYTLASVTNDTNAVLSSSAPTLSVAAWNLQSPLLNISANGSAYTGSVTTGNRGTSAFDDSMVTGKLYADSLWCLTDTTYTDDDANFLPATVALFRYKNISSVYHLQVSTTVTSGIRNWVDFGGGVGVATDKEILYNKAGAVYGDINLEWDYTAQAATIKGIAATPALNVLIGYVASDGGYTTSSTSYQSIQSPDGGILTAGSAVVPNGGLGGYIGINPLNYGSGTFPSPLAPLLAFGATTVLLWAAGGTNGTASPPTVGLHVNSFVNAAVGFVTENTAYNAIQAPLGGLSVAGIGVVPVTSSGGYGGYIGINPLNYGAGTFPIQLPPLSGFGATTILMWGAGGTNGTTSAPSVGLHINSFVNAFTGFVTENSIYNSIQTPNGGFVGAGLGITDNGSKGGYIGFNPLTYGGGSPYPVPLQPIGSFSANSVIVFAAGVNGTVTPLTTIGLMTNAYINAAAGFVTLSNATNAIQAPNGGLTANWLIAQNSLFFLDQPSAPPLAGSNQARIYLTNTGILMMSFNGGAYAPLGGGAPGLPNNSVQFNSGPGTFTGSANFTWNNVAQALAITGITATAGLTVLNGYIGADGGFVTSSNSYQAVQAPSGGLYASGLGVTNSANKGGYIDIPPIGYAAYPTPLTSASFGGTDVLLWSSGTNGTVTPLTTIGLNTNAYINAAAGFATLGSATNIIQAPNGGVTGAYLIATNSLFFTELSSAPPLSGSGQVRIYFSNTGQMLFSVNTGPYNPLGNPAGSDQWIQYNKANVFGADSHFTWNYTSQAMVIQGIATTPGLTVQNGYIGSDGGFVTSSNSYQAVQSPNGGGYHAGLGITNAASRGGYIDIPPIGYATYPTPLVSASFSGTDVLLWSCGTNGTVTPLTTIGLNTNAFINAAAGFSTLGSATNIIQAPNGGVTGLWLIATNSIFMTELASAPPLSGAGQVRIYFSTSGQMFFSANTGAYNTLGTPAGSDQWMQYNKAGVFGADTNLSWNYTSRAMVINGIAATPGLTVQNGYIGSDGGFTTGSFSYQAIQSPIGGGYHMGLGIVNGLSNTINRGGYIDFTPLSYATYPVALTNASFGGSDIIMFASASNGTVTPVLTTHLCINGAMDAANGFYSVGSNDNIFQAPLGGMTARRHIATFDFAHAGLSSGFPVGATNQGKLYFDSSQNKWMVLQGTNAAVAMIGSGGAPGGILNQIQYNNGAGGFAATSQFYVDTTNNAIVASALNGSAALIAEVVDQFNNQAFLTPGLVGRKISGISGGYLNTFSGSYLFSLAARGCLSTGPIPTATAKINVMATENWSSFGNGSEMQFVNTPNGSISNVTQMWIRNYGVVEIQGRAGNNGCQLNNGWFSTVDTTNGGYHASGNQYNVIQAPSGGVYVGLGVTTDQALYPHSFGISATPNTPASGYAGFGHRSGSTFWYYNPSTLAWNSVDFNAVGGGGVTSITVNTSMTGAITITGTAGITVSNLSNTISIQGSGFALLAGSNFFSGTQNQFNNAVIFGPNIGSGYTINASSGIFAGSTKLHVGTNIGGVSPGVYCGPGILMNQGCLASGFNIYLQNNGGGTWQVAAGGGTTSVAIQIPATNGITYYFIGGVLVGASNIGGIYYSDFATTAPF